MNDLQSLFLNSEFCIEFCSCFPINQIDLTNILLESLITIIYNQKNVLRLACCRKLISF